MNDRQAHMELVKDAQVQHAEQVAKVIENDRKACAAMQRHKRNKAAEREEWGDARWSVVALGTAILIVVGLKIGGIL